MNNCEPHPFSDSPLLEAVNYLLLRQSTFIPEGHRIRVIIAGGIAVHIWTLVNVTHDLDCEFDTDGRFIPDQASIPFELDGHSSMVYIDMNYNSSYAMMHEDYQEDAAYLKQIGQFDVSVLPPPPLTWHSVNYRVGMREIELLAKAGLMTAAALSERAEAAIRGAIGNMSVLKINI